MAKEKEMAQQTGKKWVDFEELTLCNNFMFGEVIADEKAGKDILEVILGKEIEKIVVYEKEKTLDNVPGQRGVRFDVYLKDQADTITTWKCRWLTKRICQREVGITKEY